MTYSNEGKTPNQDSADIKAQQEINIDDLDMETLERLTSPDNDQDPSSVLSSFSASAASSSASGSSENSSAAADSDAASTPADPSADDIAYAVDQMASGTSEQHSSDDIELDPSTFAGSNLSMNDDSASSDSDSSDTITSGAGSSASDSDDELDLAGIAGAPGVTPSVSSVSPAGAAVDASINDNESPRLRVYDDAGNELSDSDLDTASGSADTQASEPAAGGSEPYPEHFAGGSELPPEHFAGASVSAIEAPPAEPAAIVIADTSASETAGNGAAASMIVDSAATDDDNSFELDIQNAAQSMSIYEPDPATAGSDGKDGLTAQTAAMVASAVGHEEAAASTAAPSAAAAYDDGAAGDDTSGGAGQSATQIINTGIRTGGTAPDGARVMANAQITSEGTSAIIGLGERHVTPVHEPSVAVARNMSADDLAILARFNTKSSRHGRSSHNENMDSGYDMSSAAAAAAAAAEVADEAAALFGQSGISTGGTAPDGAIVMKNAQITAAGTSAIIGLESRLGGAASGVTASADDHMLSAAARAVDEAAAAMGESTMGTAQSSGAQGAGTGGSAGAAAAAGIRTGGTVPDGAKVMNNALITSDGTAAIIGLGERHVTPVHEPSAAASRKMSAEDLAILASFNKKSERRSRRSSDSQGADSGALIMNESTMSDTGSTAIVGLGESHVTPVQQVSPELNRAGGPLIEDVDSEKRSPYRMQARDHESLHETGSSNIIVDRKHAQNNAPVTTIFENGMVMDEGHTAIMGLENRAAAPERDESSTLITGMQADNLESLHAFNEEYARSKQAHFEAAARFRAEMDAERNMAGRAAEGTAAAGAGAAVMGDAGMGGTPVGAASDQNMTDLDSQMLAGISRTDTADGQNWQDYEGSNGPDGQSQWPDQRYYAPEPQTQPQSAPGEYYDPLYDTVPQRRSQASWQNSQDRYAPQESGRNDYYNWSEYDQGEVQAMPVDRQPPEDDGPHYVVGRQPRYNPELDAQQAAAPQEEESVYVGTYASRLAREKAQQNSERAQGMGGRDSMSGRDGMGGHDGQRGEAGRGDTRRERDAYSREQAARNGHVQHFDENGYPVDNAWQAQGQGEYAQSYDHEDAWSGRPQNFGPDGMPQPQTMGASAMGPAAMGGMGAAGSPGAAAMGAMGPDGLPSGQGISDMAGAMGAGLNGQWPAPGTGATGSGAAGGAGPGTDAQWSGAEGGAATAAAASDEERAGPVPAGMGDGPLLQVDLNQGGNGSWEEPDDGPVYHVGPKENTRRMQELMAERPVYAIGVKSSNADVMANIEATRNKIQGNRALPPMKLNNAPFEDSPLSPEEEAAYEEALAEAARESMAAPQSEVVRRARILAQGDGKSSSTADTSESDASRKAESSDNEGFATEFANAAALSGASVDTGKHAEGEYASDDLVRAAADATENEEQMLAVHEDRLAEEAAGTPDNREVIEPRNRNGEPRRSVADESKEELLTRMNVKDHVSFSMMIFLYIRQLFASFFTHTTLPLAAPQLSLRLGPCYPSSMPVPFFFVGLVAGLTGSVLHATIELNYVGSISYLAYLLLTGLTAYRGIYRICSYITRRRHDVILLAASVMVPMLVFIWLANTLIVITDGIVEATAAFAIASMLSAATATSLTWNFPQDPMDSLGRMTTRGLLFVIVLSLMAAFGLLNYIVGLSVLGVSIVMRLIFGYFIARNQGTAQRPYVYALQMLTLFAVLFDLIMLKSQNYEFLSYSTVEFVHFLRSYSTLF